MATKKELEVKLGAIIMVILQHVKEISPEIMKELLEALSTTNPKE